MAVEKALRSVFFTLVNVGDRASCAWRNGYDLRTESSISLGAGGGEGVERERRRRKMRKG